LEEKNRMKKLMTSAVLTFAAVPFLVAAPSAGKAQSQAATGPAAAKPKAQKKHVKKAAKSHVVTPNADSTTPSPAK
jgi:hypothetical protein